MDTPGSLVDPTTHRCGSRFSNTNISENSKPKSERLEGSVRDLGQSDLCKNIGKTGSFPCPFKSLQIRAQIVQKNTDPDPEAE